MPTKRRIGHVLDGHAAETGLLAVDVDADRGIIELLIKLHVAKLAYFLHLVEHAQGMAADGVAIRPDHEHLDRVRRAEAHDRADDIARFEAKGHLLCPRLGFFGRNPFLLKEIRQPGHDFFGQRLAEAVAELRHRDAALFLQPHSEHAVVARPHEKQNIVRGRVRGAHSRIADRHFDLAAAFLVDDIENS